MLETNGLSENMNFDLVFLTEVTWQFEAKPTPHQHSAVPLPVLDFLKTTEGEVFQISNLKMLIITQSWRFFRNFHSQVQQFLARAMTEFTLGVYKLHTQYFDLIFLLRQLSYLRQFKSFT